MKHAERPGLRRWTRGEYERLLDHGFLDEDDPVEPLDGLLLVKEPAYARARIADYWIVNLGDRVLEVHREPSRRRQARAHRGYGALDTLGAAATVAPLAAPAARIRAADLLP